MDDKETKVFWHLLGERFDRIDRAITHWMAETGLTLLRISLGIVFFWFGALKLFPDSGPAANLIRESITFLPANIFIPFLGIWEMVIGLGFITGRWLRVTILLMVLQMIGAASPLVLKPDAVWQTFPFVLTLEGQYIIKNVVLIAAAFVIGATVRGGELVAEQKDE